MTPDTRKKPAAANAPREEKEGSSGGGSLGICPRPWAMTVRENKDEDRREKDVPLCLGWGTNGG